MLLKGLHITLQSTVAVLQCQTMSTEVHFLEKNHDTDKRHVQGLSGRIKSYHANCAKALWRQQYHGPHLLKYLIQLLGFIFRSYVWSTGWKS
jgi:hypothetical protein